MRASAVATVKPGGMHNGQYWLVAGSEIMWPDAKVGNFMTIACSFKAKIKHPSLVIFELSILSMSVGKIFYTTADGKSYFEPHCNVVSKHCSSRDGSW